MAHDNASQPRGNATGQRAEPGMNPETEGVDKLPHERDESNSSETTPDRPDNARKGRQGAEDVERGVTDTSRATEAQQTYDRHLRDED